MKINGVEYTRDDIIKAAKLGISISKEQVIKEHTVTHDQCFTIIDLKANIVFRIEGQLTMIATTGIPNAEYKILSKHMLKKTHAVMVDSSLQQQPHPYTQKPYQQKRRY